jgi:hypothetical protein
MMAQHSESFDDIFHFYNFQPFLRLNLFLTALLSVVAIQTATLTIGTNRNAMQMIDS